LGKGNGGGKKGLELEKETNLKKELATKDTFWKSSPSKLREGGLKFLRGAAVIQSLRRQKVFLWEDWGHREKEEGKRLGGGEVMRGAFPWLA